MLDDILVDGSSRKGNRTRVVLAFGLLGIASGWISESLFQNLTVASRTAPHFIGPGNLFLPDLFLLLALIIAFVFCQKIGWLSVRRTAGRTIGSALLITVNSLFGFLAGLFTDIAWGVTIGSKFSGDNPVVAEIPPILVSVVGLSVSALVLSLAAYLFASRWNKTASISLMVCAFAISVAVTPIFMGPTASGAGANGAGAVAFFQVTMFLTHTLYSACLGYWLT